MNDVTVNPDKFQAIIMSCDKKKENKYDLQIKFLNIIIIIQSLFNVGYIITCTGKLT